MRRRVFDVIASTGGLLVVVVLIAAGALGLWAASWTSTNVHNQLAEQEIYFPSAAAFAHAKAGTEVTPQMVPYLSQYAGQEVLTGAQAEAYADHFIAYHLYAMPFHGVYAKVSAAARAAKPGSPQAASLAALETTVFQGTTLRGLLLEAYGFSQFGQVAFVGAIISFVLAGLMLVLVALGYWHSRKVSEEEELLATTKRERAAA
ncbi:MAG TPA: hypothetical protein VKU92_00030 [Acidimicrobiales bacterium]|nr:hypothetical protein [Acidimicrobiales bacterium]